MWYEETTDKNGNTKYRFRENYFDPRTNSWRKKSIVKEKKTREAQRQAQLELQELIDTELNRSTAQTKITIESLINVYLPVYQSNVKRTTFISIQEQYTVFSDYFGKQRIFQSINVQDLNRFFDYLLHERQLSNATVSIYKSRINKLFSYATRTGYIPTNIMNDVIIEYKARSKQKKQLDKFLEDDEYQRLIEYTSNHNLRYRLLFEWLYLTGMRCGEALALTYDKIDLNDEQPTAIIDTTLEYKKLSITEAYTSESPKTQASNRVISLPDACIEIINECKRINRYTDNNSYIFQTSRGTPMSIHALNTYLRANKEKMDIDKPLSSHIFRHTHISKLAEMGIPLHAIQNRVGHEDSKITERIYLHVTKKIKDELYNKIKKM